MSGAGKAKCCVEGGAAATQFGRAWASGKNENSVWNDDETRAWRSRTSFIDELQFLINSTYSRFSSQSAIDDLISSLAVYRIIDSADQETVSEDLNDLSHTKNVTSRITM